MNELLQEVKIKGNNRLVVEIRRNKKMQNRIKF